MFIFPNSVDDNYMFIFPNSVENFGKGELWQNDIPMSLEESNRKFNELTIYDTFLGTRYLSIGPTNLDFSDGRYVTYPNGYIYDHKLTYMTFFNKVLEELKDKFNNVPKITRTFIGFDSENDPVELTVEYLKKYEDFRNTHKRFKLEKGNEPKIESISCSSDIYKSQLDSDNIQKSKILMANRGDDYYNL